MKHLLVFLAVLPVLVPGQSITVNLGTTYQTIDGFGFSEAFGFVSGIYGLPAAQQKVAFDYLFSKTTGAALNIVRNRIGSDSGTTIEPNNPGGPSATPKYVALPNNDENQLWFSLIAKNNYSVPTFYADAWSAPGYMKTTGNEANGGYLCGVTGETCSSGDWRTAYANYLVQYLKDYQAAGINVNYVGFLNEPEFDASYSSMLSDGTQAASFISVFAPILKASGLSTGITCCDAEGWNMQKTFTAQLTSAGAIPNLALITSHSYTSSPTSPISTTLRVWQTEYADLDGDNMVAWYSNGDASEGLTWANHIYTALVNANISAYLHWIGIQSGVPNAALVGINNNQPVPTGRLWAFGLWSRYVQPGAVRIGAAGSTGSSLVSAFKNLDGSISVQVINNGDSAQTVSIKFSGLTPTTVQAFYTSNTNNNIGSTTASISGGAVSGSSPARSMVVFVVNGTGGGTTTSAHSSTTTTSTTTTHSSTTTPVTGCSAEWGQCGGIGWTGATCCASGTTCQSSNPYYSQCLAS